MSSTSKPDPKIDYKNFFHRDSSWTDFNERVLAEANDKKNPILERFKFLAISSTNLDEFFMIRIPSLLKALKKTTDEAKFQHYSEAKGKIFDFLKKFHSRQSKTLSELAKELKTHSFKLHVNDRFSPKELIEFKKIFDQEIAPKLPELNKFNKDFIEKAGNFSILGVFERKKLALVLPSTLPTLYFHQSAQLTHVLFIEHLLEHFLPQHYQLQEDVTLIRITRDGDFSVEASHFEGHSLPEKVRKSLKARDHGKVVRLQIHKDIPQTLKHYLVSKLKLNERFIDLVSDTFQLHSLWRIISYVNANKTKPESKLLYPPFKAWMPEYFKETHHFFERLQKSDILLHHPYDSFEAYLKWIEMASQDPHVKEISQTIYRTDPQNRIIDALKKAAKTKKVRVLIELRARFDELNNLKLSEELKRAGVEVGFGFGDLKLHAKVAVITRLEKGELHHYTHLSTGNYKLSTASVYTDLALFTSNRELGEDAHHFFNSIFNEKVPSIFKKLISAPTGLHRKINTLITNEIKNAQTGKPARIVAKVNALVDYELIQKLYQASQAGVKIDLIVRGACSLKPGVKGLSENIRVVSIVDRFLEHSRLYYFESSKSLYLSSADWMPRNLFSRLEIAFPILDPKLYEYLTQTLIELYWKDTEKARFLTPSGKWVKNSNKTLQPLRVQFKFIELAETHYSSTNLKNHHLGDHHK